MAMTSDSPNDPQNAHPDSDSTLNVARPAGAPGTRIGPYQLLQLLGEGGMGEVWLAEQKTPLHRTVALKLIKAGMDTKAVVTRFETERQALALMDHPCIAQVFEAGSTPEGRPYFAMEYVPGLPITEYCDSRRLTIKERLQLFTQVCEGVQHAHQKAIIHRDLKPSNVLVLEQDNKAVPKIIDFGLAKAMAQRLTERSFFTELGVMLGTPEYMSPEQADQREQNIDTRTDVYSLGVILYELLVGAVPFDAKALRAAGLAEILRVIREEEPPKPSTRIRSLGDASAASAEKRKEEPRSFAKRLQGELDWITMKTLEKNRIRRYGTPTELSADISRYLRNEPVVAGPATVGYRIKKYAARHRAALGAAAGSILLLAGFAVAQAIELRRIKEERDRANRERDRATRITDFMKGMFRVTDPSEARGNSITVREVLDKASNDVETGLAKDPETQGQILNGMGDIYENLGLYGKAESLLRKAVEVFSDHLGPEHQLTLRSKNDLGVLLRREGHFDAAEKTDREVLDGFRRTLGPLHSDTLTAMMNLADILNDEGRSVEAERFARDALENLRRVLGPEHLRTLSAMNILANILYHEARYGEAEAMHRGALEISSRVLGPESPSAIMSMGNLANDLFMEGKIAEAEKFDRQALSVDLRVLGAEHPATLEEMNNLANALYMEKRYREAETLYRQTLDVRRRVLGPEHPITLTSMSNLAMLLTVELRFGEAEKLFRETLNIQRRLLGPDHRETALTTYNLACLKARQGQRDDALSLLLQAVDHGLPTSAALGMDKDSDLTSLHGDPRFVALLAHAKERAAATQKPN